MGPLGGVELRFQVQCSGVHVHIEDIITRLMHGSKVAVQAWRRLLTSKTMNADVFIPWEESSGVNFPRGVKGMFEGNVRGCLGRIFRRFIWGMSWTSRGIVRGEFSGGDFPGGGEVREVVQGIPSGNVRGLINKHTHSQDIQLLTDYTISSVS